MGNNPRFWQDRGIERRFDGCFLPVVEDGTQIFISPAVEVPHRKRRVSALIALQNCGGQAADFASALASPPRCFALAVGCELLIGQHPDQDDGSHHREVE